MTGLMSNKLSGPKDRFLTDTTYIAISIVFSFQVRLIFTSHFKFLTIIADKTNPGQHVIVDILESKSIVYCFNPAWPIGVFWGPNNLSKSQNVIQIVL